MSGRQTRKNTKQDKQSGAAYSNNDKRGGAGGKGTWGKPGDEQYPASAAMDKGDPNYDSREVQR